VRWRTRAGKLHAATLLADTDYEVTVAAEQDSLLVVMPKRRIEKFFIPPGTAVQWHGRFLRLGSVEGSDIRVSVLEQFSGNERQDLEHFLTHSP
jgi:hypothetical protein